MWFGTQYGLDRYDGYTYKVFLHDPKREDSLGCATIRALFRDSAGGLWVGCDQSIDRYDAGTQTFKHYALKAAVFSISQDRSGRLWVSSNNGLFCLDTATGHLKRYGHGPEFPQGLSSNDVKMTAEDREGRFWVSDGGKLEELDRERGAVLRSVDVPSTARSAVMFYIDRHDVFWVLYTLSGQESGLAVLDRETNHLMRYPLSDESGHNITVGIHTAIEDSNGTLWFATNGAGLLKLDREKWSISRYRNHMGDSESIADDRIIALCADSEGNVWEGLYAMEPNFFHSTQTGFTPLLREHDNPKGLGESFINAIYKDHANALWISTTGSFVRVDPQTGKRTFYSLPGKDQNDDIIAIAEDHDGHLWLGTIGSGLNRFDPATGKYIAYVHDARNKFSISSDVVSRIVVASDDTLWISTWDGLNHFDPGSGHSTVYRYLPNRAEHIFNVAQDTDGTLWMGGFSGLYHFDPVREKFTVYSHIPGDAHSLSDNVVNAVLLGRDGAVWVTTENGLNKLDRRSGTFQTYSVQDGLASNSLSCALEDRSGRLWISSNRGLANFDTHTNRFRNYSSADGIPSVDLTGWDACYKDTAGKMYFGGFGGGFAFDSNEGLGRREAFPIALTEFQIADHPVAIASNATLTQAIDHTQALTLSHAQNRFSLTFAGLGFWNSTAIRYRYRLEGLDTDWTVVGSEGRTVTYTTLPAGRYLFRAQAETRPDVWSDPGVALKVTVLPPWWATLWFRTVLGLVLGALLWMAYLARLRQAKAEIQIRAEERIEERERIARELHDTLLQSVQGLIWKVHAAALGLPQGEPARTLIENALHRADEVVLEGRDRVRSLRTAPWPPIDLPSSFKKVVEELAPMSPIKFQILVAGTERTLLPLVRDEVYWIGREALSNAFRHSGGKEIVVEMSYGPRSLHISFQDDGIGGAADVLQSESTDGHWGLIGMHERAKRIGGTLKVSNRSGGGTLVDLKVPNAFENESAPRDI